MRTHTHSIGLLLLFISLFISCNKPDDLPVVNYYISYPNGGEVLFKGITHSIKWEGPFSKNASIELYKDSDLFYSIEETIANTGVYQWDIPADILEGPDYKIKISDPDNRNSSALSSRSFFIRAAIEKSTFTDERDGQTYKTVKIGDQWWMAENFNFNSESGSHCYFDIQSNCEQYGKLYSLEAALVSCPPGWHLPADSEWKNLETYLGIYPDEINITGHRGLFAGNLLRPGGGTGFDALYGGYYNSCVDYFAHMLWEAHFLTATLTQDGKLITRIIQDGSGGIARVEAICHGGSSVRYVMD